MGGATPRAVERARDVGRAPRTSAAPPTACRGQALWVVVAGRLVRQVYTGEDRIGHYERQWDGTDDAGELVPPGVYLYRASVDTDKNQVNQVGTIHVAY